MKNYLVYFWATEDRQFVKIGRCQGNLHSRGVTIQNGCPIPLNEYPAALIFCEDKGDMLKVEKKIHEAFSEYRTQGEWFNLTPEISEYIQQIMDIETVTSVWIEERKNYREIYRNYRRERRNNPECTEYRPLKKREKTADGQLNLFN